MIRPRPLNPKECARLTLVHQALERVTLIAAVFLLIGGLFNPPIAFVQAWSAVYAAIWLAAALYQPTTLIGAGNPTWPLEPLLIAAALAYIGGHPWVAAAFYGLGYLYARTLGRRLSRQWFDCEVERA